MVDTTHHLIFEGAELTGKSYLIHQVWNFLEEKYNTGQGIMDGCTWFNADVGLFGSKDGWPLVEGYLNIARTLRHRNLIFEKLHFTQHIYSEMIDEEKFLAADEALADLGFRVVLTTVDNDPYIFEYRLGERLKSNHSYQRIARTPEEYLESQNRYRRLSEKSKLDVLVVNNTQIPNELGKSILGWLGESVS